MYQGEIRAMNWMIILTWQELPDHSYAISQFLHINIRWHDHSHYLKNNVNGQHNVDDCEIIKGNKDGKVQATILSCNYCNCVIMDERWIALYPSSHQCKCIQVWCRAVSPIKPIGIYHQVLFWARYCYNDMTCIAACDDSSLLATCL